MDVKEEILTATPEEIVPLETAPSSAICISEKKIYSFFKRVFDIIFSAVALVVLFLPLIVIAVIIVIDSPGASPVFSQMRVGKNGKEFKFYKFRSMVPKAENMLGELLPQNEMEGPAFKIKEDPRTTRFGRFIRKTSIDELPQFWNVLKGDMSLVGPRPPLPREVEFYSEHHHKRLCITPGITCYWQVQPKRNSISFDDWVELDLKYISERSFITDIKILFKTIGAVCGMEGE